ncbi:hypothetical protein V1291_003751 [Nitrobacteraceae bacterium AZCC 1564]
MGEQTDRLLTVVAGDVRPLMSGWRSGLCCHLEVRADQFFRLIIRSTERRALSMIIGSMVTSSRM